MNKLTLLAASLTLSVMAVAQSFEGSLEFKMETTKDTTTNIYYVKNNTIKLDQMGRKGDKIEGSFVFDIGTQKILYTSPVRRVYGEYKTETPPTIKGTCVVTKGSATKTILGQKCAEYVVKNTTENTMVTYWITSAKYDFFAPVVKLWNRKDKQSVYLNQIKDLPKGSMPLMSEERTISDNKLVTKLEFLKITKNTVEPSKLSIPADYKKYDQK